MSMRKYFKCGQVNGMIGQIPNWAQQNKRYRLFKKGKVAIVQEFPKIQIVCPRTEKILIFLLKKKLQITIPVKYLP